MIESFKIFNIYVGVPEKFLIVPLYEGVKADPHLLLILPSLPPIQVHGAELLHNLVQRVPLRRIFSTWYSVT